MKIHEYQGKDILRKYGVPTLKGVVCTSVTEVEQAAEQLGVTVGDPVIALVSQGITTPAGVVPRMRRFRVTGIFYAGMYEFDRALVFVNVADAQRLLRFGDDVTGVRLAIDDGNFGGRYQRDDAAMEEIWQIAVQETRTMLEAW